MGDKKTIRVIEAHKRNRMVIYLDDKEFKKVEELCKEWGLNSKSAMVSILLKAALEDKRISLK